MEDNINSIWAEPLPENCPPVDSEIPDSHIFFRLVDIYPPEEKIFILTENFIQTEGLE